MIILFLIFSYFSTASTNPISFPNFSDSPLSLLSSRQDAGTTTSTPTTCFCPDQRSIWDIIWGCLVTVFACSWVSVHPDIPAPRENWRSNSLRRLEYMFWTILTPELTIYWSVRQWKGAHRIARDQGWTYTQGHFLQMGGFILYNGTSPRGVLSYDRYKELLQNARISPPAITKNEIDDRSKSDGLSKTLVFIQTGWFVLQCIARKARGMPITELELSTLAFAALNGLMYFFWWDKPFDVQSTVPVMLLPKSESEVNEAEAEAPSSPSPSPAMPIPQHIDDTGTVYQRPPHPRRWTSIIPSTLSTTYHFLTSRLSAIIEHHDGEFAAFEDLKSEADITPMRVPTFYAYMFKADEDDYIALLFALPLIGTTFGAIHCAGWGFAFPSGVELWSWRVCSVYITASPFVIFFLGVVNSMGSSDDSVCMRVFYKVCSLLFAGGVIIYVAARFILLVVSFTTLRDLPPEAYDVVKWTSFIPHI